MPKVAAFRWDKSKHDISFMVINDDTYSVLDEPQKIDDVGDDGAVNAAIAAFCEVLKGHPDGGVVERLTVISSPTYPADERSKYVEKHLKIEVARVSKWKLADERVKSDLKKEKLVKFSSGLNRVGLCSLDSGDAYVHHLWRIALHEGNPEAGLKILWKIKEGIAAKMTKVESAQFRAWYADLPSELNQRARNRV